ncbi:MAG: NAD(P)H-binding protein [Pseudomonadota bacterium]
MGRIVLAGASGYLGRHVARELIRRGHSLLLPMRAAVALPQAEQERTTEPTNPSPQSVDSFLVDFRDRETLTEQFRKFSPDGVVSCISSRQGGIEDAWQVDYAANRGLLDASLASGVKHFTLLSAICVQKPRLAFQLAKLRFEQELIASGLKYSIVRPTAFFKSLSGQVERVKAGKPFFLFGDGQLTRCKPIAERDLAEYLCNTLEQESLQGVLPIGGPGTAISPLEQARLLFQCANKPLRLRRIPAAAPKHISRLLAVPGRWSSRWQDRAEFARIAHYYATESMLLWDERQQCYDADATPSFGSVHLEDSYRDQLSGINSQELGQQAVFSRH